jgi:outer membrane lipoprotein carrier protein
MLTFFCRVLATLVLLVTVLPLPAHAETGPANAFNCDIVMDKTAGSALLSKVQERYQGVNSLHAAFAQESFLAALDQREGSTGEVWFAKPGKMRWDYQRPEAQEFIVNDHTMWLYQPELNQVIIQPLEAVLLSNLPVAFLMGIGNIKNDFSLEKACRNTLGVVLELSPKKQKSEDELKVFKLLVDEARGLPQGAQISDAGGNITSVHLREIKTNAEAGVSEERFKADYPAGTDISDRRSASVP